MSDLSHYEFFHETLPDEESDVVQCKFCKTCGLYWITTDNGPRLVDEEGELHKCHK